jgi:hypothetical protein
MSYGSFFIVVETKQKKALTWQHPISLIHWISGVREERWLDNQTILTLSCLHSFAQEQHKPNAWDTLEINIFSSLASNWFLQRFFARRSVTSRL